MKIEELRRHCARQIELAGPDASIVITMPGAWNKRTTRRLCFNGPTGNIVSNVRLPGGGREGVVVEFKAQDILDAMDIMKMPAGDSDGG